MSENVNVESNGAVEEQAFEAGSVVRWKLHKMIWGMIIGKGNAKNTWKVRFVNPFTGFPADVRCNEFEIELVTEGEMESREAFSNFFVTLGETIGEVKEKISEMTGNPLGMMLSLAEMVSNQNSTDTDEEEPLANPFGK